MTMGGDVVGDRGGEKATMEVGRDLGTLQGDRMLLPRGVTGPVVLFSTRFDVECRAPWWRAISSDMRPSLLVSSATARRSAARGDGCRGPAGAGVLLALRLFSKKLRREETGFCSPSDQSMVIPGHGFRAALSLFWSLFKGQERAWSCRAGDGRALTMDEPSVLSSAREGSMALLVNRRQSLRYGCSSTVQGPFPLSADGVLGQGEDAWAAGGVHAAPGTWGGHHGQGSSGRTGGASDSDSDSDSVCVDAGHRVGQVRGRVGGWVQAMGVLGMETGDGAKAGDACDGGFRGSTADRGGGLGDGGATGQWRVVE